MTSPGEDQPSRFAARKRSGSPGKLVAWEILFWVVFNLVGVVLGYYAVRDVFLYDHYGLALGFVLFVVLGVIVYFSYRDAQKISPRVTADADERNYPELAEDYIQRIHWEAVHRSRRSRMPSPQWKYQPILLREASDPLQLSSCASIVVLFAGMIVLGVGLTALDTWLKNVPFLKWLVYLVLGVVLLGAYLLWQDQRERPRSSKRRAKTETESLEE